MLNMNGSANIDAFVFAIWAKAVREVVHFQECSGTLQSEASYRLKQGSPNVFVLKAPQRDTGPCVMRFSPD